MRKIVSIIVASFLFLLVVYLAISGRIVLVDYWTGLAVLLTATSLGILYWGFKPQINSYLKGRAKLQNGKTETAVSSEREIQKESLLPDSAKITELNIDDKMLDQIYEETRRKALDIYDDAQLSYFTIQVYPFRKSGRPIVSIYMNFYSKWADKICKFQYSTISYKLRHFPPDKPPISNSNRQVFTTLPWKTSPQWMQFLGRVYDKIKPLPKDEKTVYHLSAHPDRQTYWTVTFEDGLSGKEYRYQWNGRGLDENSIKQVR